MSQSVHDLQRGVGINIRNNDVAVVDEGEGVWISIARSKHQLEAALIVCSSGIEAVERSGQQVNIDTCRIIRKEGNLFVTFCYQIMGYVIGTLFVI